MITTDAETCEQRGLKTYRVLDAMLEGFNQIPSIVARTELSYRTVNALVYALEKQGRVVAQDYDAQRCNQIFTVLQYEASTASSRSKLASRTKRSFDALHPASVHTTIKVQNNFKLLHQAFFFRTAAAMSMA